MELALRSPLSEFINHSFFPGIFGFFETSVYQRAAATSLVYWGLLWRKVRMCPFVCLVSSTLENSTAVHIVGAVLQQEGTHALYMGKKRTLLNAVSHAIK